MTDDDALHNPQSPTDVMTDNGRVEASGTADGPGQVSLCRYEDSIILTTTVEGALSVDISVVVPTARARELADELRELADDLDEQFHDETGGQTDG